MTSDTRPLSEIELQIATKVLRAGSVPEIAALVDQLSVTRVRTSSSAMLLDLEVPTTALSSRYPDGPLPIRSFVEDCDGQPAGEIILWIEGGYLSALEYAWTSEETPSEWPSPSNLRTEGRADD